MENTENKLQTTNEEQKSLSQIVNEYKKAHKKALKNEFYPGIIRLADGYFEENLKIIPDLEKGLRDMILYRIDNRIYSDDIEGSKELQDADEKERELMRQYFYLFPAEKEYDESEEEKESEDDKDDYEEEERKETTQERIDTMIEDIGSGASPDEAFCSYLDEDCFGVKNTADIDALVRIIYELDLSDREIKSSSLQIAEFLQKFDSKNNNKIEDQKLFPYFINQIAKCAGEMIKEKNSVGNQDESDLKEELGKIKEKLKTMVDTISEYNKSEYIRRVEIDRKKRKKQQSKRQIAELCDEETLKTIIFSTLNEEDGNFTITSVTTIFNTTNTTDEYIARNNFSHLYAIMSQYPLEQRVKLIELLPSLEDEFLHKDSLTHCLRTIISLVINGNYHNLTSNLDDLILFCKTLENTGEKLKEKFGTEVNNHAIFEIAIGMVTSPNFAQLEKDYDARFSSPENDNQFLHKVIRHAKIAIDLDKKGSEYDQHLEQKFRELVSEYKNLHTANEIEKNDNDNEEQSYPGIIDLADRYLETRFNQDEKANLARNYKLEQELIDAIEYRIDNRVYSNDKKDNREKRILLENMETLPEPKYEDAEEEAFEEDDVSIKRVREENSEESWNQKKKYKASKEEEKEMSKEEKHDFENSQADENLDTIRAAIFSTMSGNNFTQNTVESILRLIKVYEESNVEEASLSLRYIEVAMSEHEVSRKIEMLNFIPELKEDLLNSGSLEPVIHLFVSLITNKDLTVLCDNANNLKAFCGALSSCTNQLCERFKLPKLSNEIYQLDQRNLDIIANTIGRSNKFPKLKEEYSKLSEGSDEKNSFFHAVTSYAKTINEGLAPSRSAQNPNSVDSLKKNDEKRR